MFAPECLGDTNELIALLGPTAHHCHALPCVPYKPTDWKPHQKPKLLEMTSSSRKLRWYQFSLRSLLVVVTLVSVFMSLIAVTIRASGTAAERCGGNQEGWEHHTFHAW